MGICDCVGEGTSEEILTKTRRILKKNVVKNLSVEYKSQGLQSEDEEAQSFLYLVKRD